MCVVSAITEPMRTPDAPWGPKPPWDAPRKPFRAKPLIREYKVTTAFSTWGYIQCLAYVELLEKAQKFDEVNGEPECSDSTKTGNLKELRKRITEIGLEQSYLSEECLALVVRLDAVIEKL